MLSDAKSILQVQLSNKATLPRCMSIEDTSIIPEKYNFREAFADCNRPLQSQGNCSSSYSVVAASVLSDRICQNSKGTVKVSLSAQHALSCDSNKNNGCKGGSVSTVFDFARKEGLVDETCFPYSADAEIPCPTTLSTCKKYQASEYCVTSSEEGIKREIKKNGPVVAVLPIYRDFLVYKDGIYRVVDGTPRFQGGHAIKLVGWGRSESGENYWIAENTFGESWGIGGFIHIGTGQKQLYIEEFVLAVIPKLEGEKKEDEELDNTIPGGETIQGGVSEKNSGDTENIDVGNEGQEE